jgi:hypothetical protein
VLDFWLESEVDLWCHGWVLQPGLDLAHVVGFEGGGLEIKKGNKMHGGPQLASWSLLRYGFVFMVTRAFDVDWAAAAQDAGNVGTRFAAGFALATMPLVITWEVFEPAGDANCVVVLFLSQLVQTKSTFKLGRVAHSSTSSGLTKCAAALVMRSSDIRAAVAVKEGACSWSRTAAPAA